MKTVASVGTDEMFRNARRILTRVLPSYHVRSIEILEGGATNQNLVVRFEARNDVFVLRQYLRGFNPCEKEAQLLEVLQGLIPVPSLVASDCTGSETGGRYLIYRFLDGPTFRQVRANGSPQDMANAAHAIGHCLGVLRNCGISLVGACPLDRRFQLLEQQLAHPSMKECVGAADQVLLVQLFAKWSNVLHDLVNEESLLHGDFNHGNVLLHCEEDDRWQVAGILDWELAGIGSSLWDAARFTCYEKPDFVNWESHFISALHAERGGAFPDNWKMQSRMMNTLSAALSLTSGSVQERFVPELKSLIRSGLRGEKIG